MAVTPLSKQNTSRIAQSFYVNRENGMYVTDIDLFFGAVPPTNGEPVYVTIRALEGGVPTTDTFMAKTGKLYSEISGLVSVDGTTPCKFSFAHPVYLNAYASYAFTVETNSSEYQLWFSEIYDYVLNSTEKLVDKNAVTGSLFLSQNGVTWSAQQESDLKFRIYKANWSAYYTANSLLPVKLHNKALPFSLLTANPIKTNGTTEFYIAAPNHGMQEGDKVKITGITSSTGYIGGININNINFATAGALTIASGSNSSAPTPNESRDWTGMRVIAGSHSANTALTIEDGGGSGASIEKNFLYTSMIATVDPLAPPHTQVSFGVKSTKAGKNPYNAQGGNLYERDTTYTQIQTNKTMFFRDQPRIIAGPTQEAAHPSATISNNKTFEIVAKLSSDDPENVMPLIDAQRMNVAVQAPVIDNPSSVTNTSDGLNKPLYFVPETNATGGTAAAKHISIVFPLASSAVGIKVLLAAHRPSVAGVDLYYRTGLDGDNLASKSWTYMPPDNNPPSDDIAGIFREYEYLIGGNTGIDPFEKFQFKIVLTSQNMTLIPTVKDFRAIALGT